MTALVKNITYENTDTGDPTAGARTLRFTVNDGNGGTSANHDATVTVSSVNGAPVITSASSASVPENMTSVLTVTATDEEGDTPTEFEP